MATVKAYLGSGTAASTMRPGGQRDDGDDITMMGDYYKDHDYDDYDGERRGTAQIDCLPCAWYIRRCGSRGASESTGCTCSSSRINLYISMIRMDYVKL